MAGLFGQQPEAAIGQPAELVVVPVDPGRIGQPVARLQARVGEIHRGDPAILVVDGMDLHGDLAAIVAPRDRGGGFAFHPHRAIAFQRILARRLAQGRHRILGDAGQRVVAERANRARRHIHQPQRLRHRIVASHAGAHILEFLVAGLGDIHRHLAFLAFVRALGLGHHHHPAAIRRHRAVCDGDIGAQVDRTRRAAAVGLAPGGFLLARRLALGAIPRQCFQRAQLLLAQCIGLGCVGRILFRAQNRGLGDAGLRRPAVPVVAVAPDHAAVAGEARLRFGVVAAGDLGQRAAAQITQEHVAVADEHHALAARVDLRVGRIQSAAFGVADPFGRGAATGGLRVGVADQAAGALEFVLHMPAIPGPPRAFDRRTDPVRIRHHLFDGQRRGLVRGELLRGEGPGKGQRQGKQQGRQNVAHGISVRPV